MKIIIDGRLNIPLFHGTSTIFLESIERHGLGGQDPIRNWNILELAQEVLQLSDVYLKDFREFDEREIFFRDMVKQSITAGGFNFQHGSGVYLSPSKEAGISYATKNIYGSELISWTLIFLKELINRSVGEAQHGFPKKYPDAFRLLKLNPAPILVQVSDVQVKDLHDEYGKDPLANIKIIEDVYKSNYDESDTLALIRTENFRLNSPARQESLKIWLINVVQPAEGSGDPKVSLHRLDMSRS